MEAQLIKETMTLYHGSDKIIRHPHYRGGKPYNDYGYGFYCTEHADLAREWSVDLGRDGFLNRYVFRTAGLQVLELNSGDYTILHWLAILLENRRFPVYSPLAVQAKQYLTECFRTPYREADVIIGYRADDSYFAFAMDFLNGTISVRQLENAMRLGKLGEQVVLRSARAFEQIEFADYEEVMSREWYPKRAGRDHKARKDYFRTDRDSWRKGELYITRILDEEIKEDDARLQRIVY